MTLLDLRRPPIISSTQLTALRDWNKFTTDNIDRLNLRLATLRDSDSVVSTVRSQAVILTTATAADVAGALTLGRGTWLIRCGISFGADPTTNFTVVRYGVSTTEDALPGSDTINVPTGGQLRQDQNWVGGFVPGGDISFTLPEYKVVVPAEQTITLRPVAEADFTVANANVYGSLHAQQIG